ncbi:acyloxyacyl hydrolase [Prolixibacter sp. NT017]|uniref:acyloxyacyl hydrolase n=1 Tax=Prolixibacter sp. NT017 TaxID=2652390 RepID=UPI001298F45A|nr:acyloxyacyl hydrolase [Prolixibacter sp. NT017]
MRRCVTRKIYWWKTIALFSITLFLSDRASAEGWSRNSHPVCKADTTDTTAHLRSVPQKPHSLIHQIGIEVDPNYIFLTNSFLNGENVKGTRYQKSFSAHLKYSFQFDSHSAYSRIFGKPYQGAGLSWYTFGDKKYLGNPMALYLFQGAQISQFTPKLSLNYEWNFGLSFGWQPYNKESNPYNTMIGSKLNAYINAGVYLNWILSPKFDLTSGVSFTHFSNGNTQYPNAGLNTIGLKMGLVYRVNREHSLSLPEPYQPLIPTFPRHVSYDMVLFGAWRWKGVAAADMEVLVPRKYTVLGFSFAPMYNFGYKLRAGLSVDGVYDGSANVYAKDVANNFSSGATLFRPEPPPPRFVFITPSFSRQWSVGISGRVEYVMPYFSINLGTGVNVLNNVGDLKSVYQVLALKIAVTRSSFIHIGYNLKDFHEPNYLMLGIGFRFHNKYPRLHR